MKKILLCCMALVAGALTINAQTLSPGQMAITGFNTNINDQDGFTFVPWVTINAGTTIRFTFDGFNSAVASTATGNWRHTAGTLSWTATVAVNAGTVVKIEQSGGSGSPSLASTGTVVVTDPSGVIVPTGIFGFSNGQETLFAYQSASLPGAPNLADNFPGVLLYGIGWQGGGTATGWLTTGTASSTNSYLPSDIAMYNHFFAGSARAAEYTGTRNTLSSVSAYIPLVNNTANWTPNTNAINPLNTTTFASVPLFVSLSAFDVKNEHGTAGLYWTTATEIDNHGFQVERSNDGRNFNTIGFVATQAVAGNSNALLQYNFQDKAPGNGTVFYRLAQLDRAGKITYSVVRSVQFETGNAFISYPNPAKDRLTLAYHLDNKGSTTVRLTDISGKLIRTQPLPTEAQELNIDLSGLSQGLYIITVSNATGVLYQNRLSKN